MGYMSLKIIQTGNIRKFECSFLFAFHSYCGSILPRFREKARYSSKIAIFSYPCIRRLRWGRGVPVRILFHPVWYGITRMVGYPTVKKNFEDMCNHLDRISACDGQTDTQMDRRTDRHLASA